MWGPAPDSGAICRDQNGYVIDCTPDCQVLGKGDSQFVIDPENPLSGEVNITHATVPSADEIGHGSCPLDPGTGGPGDRSITYIMRCDPHMEPGTRKFFAGTNMSLWHQLL